MGWVGRGSSLRFCLAWGFGEGLVGGGGWPADDDQEYIQDEESDGYVVEENRLLRVGPDLVGSPEEEGDGQQDGFDPFEERRPMRALIDEIGEGNQGQRECT